MKKTFSTDLLRSNYLYTLEQPDNIISIFDDLRYDRSDVDIISPGMRLHLLESLRPFGFKQSSGNVISHTDLDIQCIIPKFHALGSSPFDITRYCQKRSQDFYVLTPTQTACQLVDSNDLDEAVSKILQMMKQQPINVYKLLDYLEHTETHQNFYKAVAYLRDQQKSLIQKEPLCFRRSL